MRAMVNKTSNDIQTTCILRILKITFSIGKYGKVMKRKEEKIRGNRYLFLSTIVLFVDICRFLISGSAKSPLISSYV